MESKKKDKPKRSKSIKRYNDNDNYNPYNNSNNNNTFNYHDSDDEQKMKPASMTIVMEQPKTQKQIEQDKRLAQIKKNTIKQIKLTRMEIENLKKKEKEIQSLIMSPLTTLQHTNKRRALKAADKKQISVENLHKMSKTDACTKCFSP
eukprot:Pgem_evm1s14932